MQTSCYLTWQGTSKKSPEKMVSTKLSKACLRAYADKYASGQSDQGLHFPLTESLANRECINGDKIPQRYFVHVHDMNL